MKVVANKSFFGSGVQAKKGAVIEVSDKLGKAWLSAGLVAKADDKAEATLATTSPTPKKSPKKDETKTTGEVVSDDQNSDGGDQTDATADKEPTTGGNPNADAPSESDQTTSNDGKDAKADTTVVKSTDDPTKTEAVKTNPTETVKPPVGNTNVNAKKGSK